LVGEHRVSPALVRHGGDRALDMLAVASLVRRLSSGHAGRLVRVWHLPCLLLLTAPPLEFELGHAAAHNLEGIVGKLANGRYHSDGTSTNWIKIRIPGTRK
jgi:hypothetical protein